MDSNKKFLTAQEVSVILQISTVSAYRIIRRLNLMLAKQGKITIAGRVSKRFFEENIYI